MDRIALPNVYPLGGVASFPIHIKDAQGFPTSDVVLGTTTLQSVAADGSVTNQPIPGQAVSYDEEGVGLFRADIDLSDAALIASGFFADGKEIRAFMEDLQIGVTVGYGGRYKDSFYIGERIVVPSNFGDYLVRVQVIDDLGNGVPNAVVTFRNGAVKRWATTATSVVEAEVGWAELYLPEGDWYITSYGSAVSSASTVISLPNPDDEDPAYPGVEFVLETVRDSISAPDTPELTTGYFTALELGIPVAGKRYVSKLIKGPSGAYANDSQPVVATSKAAPLGLVEFTYHQPGATYTIRGIHSRRTTTVVATGPPNGSYEIEGVIYPGDE